MITIATVLLYGVVTCHPTNVDEVATLGVREAHYRLQPSELENAPQWTDLDQSPPLSPGKAVRVAESAIEVFTKEGKLEPLSSAFQWRLKRVSLVRVFDNQWYYEVTFKESVKPGFGATGRRQSATIFVLMDGTFLKPVKELTLSPNAPAVSQRKLSDEWEHIFEIEEKPDNRLLRFLGLFEGRHNVRIPNCWELKSTVNNSSSDCRIVYDKDEILSLGDESNSKLKIVPNHTQTGASIQLIEEDNSVRWEMAIESFHPRLLNQGYSALKCSARVSGSSVFLFGRSGPVRFVFVMKIYDGAIQDRIAFTTNSREDFSLPK